MFKFVDIFNTFVSGLNVLFSFFNLFEILDKLLFSFNIVQLAWSIT